ncbi:MAG: ATP-binding protein [Rhodospirillaceae bacterium]|nr:ATP-binding protein [Rhodospirillaceae bacterium]
MTSSPAQPASFPMVIQGGMLEALGINMYTTLGKCLVEFVANAYDGDAQTVDIVIPAKDIEDARTKVRADAKAEAAAGKRDPFTVLLAALPVNIEVTITDNGHGMTPAEIEQKFLPINRKRRADGTGAEKNLMSESNKRFVMGRKGLGKLAGFGAAEKVTITTKRAEDAFETTFTMDFETLRTSGNLNKIQIPASYQAAPKGRHGTIVKLSGLKCDAVKYGLESMKEVLAEAFYGISQTEFKISLNGTVIEPEPAKYEFLYPDERPHDGLARGSITVDDVGTIEFDYVVMFRKRGENLKAAQRGARIYCNNRLAAGPSLFGLPTGMHNFHSQSYMECVVRADALDRNMIDFVNTNRTQLREDTEVALKLIDAVTEEMRLALSAHSKFRDETAEKELDEDEGAKQLKAIVDRMPAKTKTSARKLLTSLASQHGIKSVQFQELAPLVIDTMNAGDVLIRLIELGSDPKTIDNVANHLKELAAIEKSDALKLYRGRRSGIIALQKLADRGEELWKEQGIEKELHELFKTEPWLIKPEFSRYLTSDADLGKVASQLAKSLKVDSFVPTAGKKKSSDDRPDLVFFMTDSESPNVVNVVELKSPTLPLDADHLSQLEGYMMSVEDWLRQHLQDETTKVHGFLIGAMPHGRSISKESKKLQYRISNEGPQAKWQVLGIRQVLANTFKVHLDAVKALEKELGEDDLGPKALLKPSKKRAKAKKKKAAKKRPKAPRPKRKAA